MIRFSFYLSVMLFLSCCTSKQEKQPAKVNEDTSIRHESSETPQAVPQKQHVSISGMKFIPEVITVSKGDTIVFTNNDIVDHDVTEEKTKAWTSSVIHSGKSWQMVPTESVDYFCSIHVVMKGKIVVE